MDIRKVMPVWVLPLSILLAIVLLGGFLWRTATATSVPAGRDIAVRPGMYNLQTELQKPHDPGRVRRP
jgi:hypothetical protein